MAEAKQDATVKQTEHQKKYDRQMRLWGAHGQKLLEEGKICMLGSNCAASETLKNCVLPAVGIFTIIDDVDVTISDLGNNFFVTQDDVGKKRSEVVAEWLLEMNPDVKGGADTRNPRELIEKEIDFFKQFDIVLATQLYGESNRKLAKYCWDNDIPYMSIKINGLMANLRVQFRELCILESHPTNDRTDLFIYPEQLKIFPELQEFCNSFDIDTKDVTEHAHLPCVAILAQYTQRWLKKHDNKLPGTFKERTEFKDEIGSMGNGENYDDAKHWASQCYFRPRIDREVQEVLDDPKAKNLTKDSSNFWIMVAALNKYRLENGGGKDMKPSDEEKEKTQGFLPCSTNIPDLTMDSKSYVKLKAIYKERAQKDYDTIKGYVKEILKSLEKSDDCIKEEIIDRFVKNVRNLKVVRTRSFEDEYNKPDVNKLIKFYEDDPMAAFEEKSEEAPFQPKMVNWYWAFRAMETFYDQEKRVPGARSGDDSAYKACVEAAAADKKDGDNDFAKLCKIVDGLFGDKATDGSITKQCDTYDSTGDKEDFEKFRIDAQGPNGDVKACLLEMIRFGGSELHNMGAFVGGVSAQGIMKILLRQFYPYNHTYVFNGIHCDGLVVDI
mmetsp:Transcript_71980/g.64674  ORF Transcript_71980/g.64674 Transcript_71980/m.64674 type:complete len:610 (-) Transcript_71980:27-1856(-)